MQLGDHGVHSVCAAVAVAAATGSPLGYASKPNVVERIIVKANTNDTSPAVNNVVLVSIMIHYYCVSN